MISILQGIGPKGIFFKGDEMLTNWISKIFHNFGRKAGNTNNVHEIFRFHLTEQDNPLLICIDLTFECELTGAVKKAVGYYYPKTSKESAYIKWYDKGIIWRGNYFIKPVLTE